MTIVINALASTGMGLIPLYFGMRKKSVPATIVSAVLIVSIVCSNNGGYSLSQHYCNTNSTFYYRSIYCVSINKEYRTCRCTYIICYNMNIIV